MVKVTKKLLADMRRILSDIADLSSYEEESEKISFELMELEFFAKTLMDQMVCDDNFIRYEDLNNNKIKDRYILSVLSYEFIQTTSTYKYLRFKKSNVTKLFVDLEKDANFNYKCILSLMD